MKFNSYFIRYELCCGPHLFDEKSNVIYTNKKIKTETDLINLKARLIEDLYATHHKEVRMIEISNIAYLGKVSKKIINSDEYMIYNVIDLKSNAIKEDNDDN